MHKIIYIVSNLRNTGPTNQLYGIINNIDRSKFTPYIITLSPESEGDSSWARFSSLDVHLDSLNLSRIKGLFCAKKELKHRIEQIKPDIIHTQGVRADVLSSKLSGGCPSLCTSRNYPYADYPAKFGKFRGAAMARQHIAAFRDLNVVACSKTIQSQLGEHGIVARVVQNGVDSDRYRVVKDLAEKEALRQMLGVPEDATVFLSTGSFILRKDMKTLVSAMKRLRSDRKTALVILGDGPQMEMLREMSRDCPVLLPGNVTNVAEYLNAADVFVSSSLSEGLPNSVLEAMSCGLPCVLSDIPSHRELFEEEQGLFFPCQDDDALSGLMMQLDSEKIADLGRRARLVVEEGFSGRKMSQGYQAIYEELIGGINGE